MGIEYVCQSCGAYVFNASGHPPPAGKCFRCAFLEETIPDPEERRAVRALLDRDFGEDD